MQIAKYDESSSKWSIGYLIKRKLINRQAKKGTTQGEYNIKEPLM